MNQNSLELSEPWPTASLRKLMDHIVQTHHVYCRQEMPRLTVLLREVLDRDGKSHPELKRIHALFTRMSNDLSMHLIKEEETLFPYIARLEEAIARKAPLSWPAFGTIRNPIRMMTLEHDQTGAEMKLIRQLTNEYTPPVDACDPYATLYRGLDAFDRDMQEHIKFENNLLFPRAVAIEEQACTR